MKGDRIQGDKKNCRVAGGQEVTHLSSLRGWGNTNGDQKGKMPELREARLEGGGPGRVTENTTQRRKRKKNSRTRTYFAIVKHKEDRRR